MSVLEASINESKLPCERKCGNVSNENDLRTPYYQAVQVEILGNVFENRSNYTKDSSLSSSCSQSYKTNITNLSLCNSIRSNDRSRNSNFSVRKPLKTPKFSTNSGVSNEDAADNVTSAVTNSSSIVKTSDKEEIVKLTKTLSLELICTTKMTPPQLKDCPQMIRSNLNENGRSSKNDLLIQEIRDRSMQYQCDRNKIINSEFMENFGSVDTIQYQVDERPRHPRVKTCPSRSIQTLPVLIWPLDCRDKVTETESTGINEQCQFSSPDDRRVIPNLGRFHTSEKYTQTFVKVVTRTRTNSDLNSYAHSKVQKVTNKNVEGNSLSRAIWGDVYNDYKQISETSKDKDSYKPQSLHRAMSTKTNRAAPKNTLDPIVTGDDIIKQPINISRFRKSYGQGKSDPIPNMNADSSKNLTISKVSTLTNKLSDDDDRSGDSIYFKRCFQVHPFDEMVKSFLTPSDRRVRAVCSRMKCHIRMFGPIKRSSLDSKSMAHPGIRDKTVYHIIISTDSKERLDKSLKCVQETFPKACLNERTFIHHNLGSYGDEIPL